MKRKFQRDKLRKKVGAKGLKEAWQRHQEKRYGHRYDVICRRPQRKPIFR